MPEAPEGEGVPTTAVYVHMTFQEAVCVCWEVNLL